MSVDIEDITQENKNTKMSISQIISCSRRCDIPAWHMPEYMRYMRRGEITIKWPREKVISLDPRDVYGWVWWTKDPGNWIKAYQENPKLFDRYGAHVFNITMNSPSELEPGIEHNLLERLDHVRWLAHRFGVESLAMRFDPVTFYFSEGKEKNNLTHFEFILSELAYIGIKDVRFSFCIPFTKTVKNLGKFDITLKNANESEQIEITKSLLKPIADSLGIQLISCAGKHLTSIEGVKESKCIDGDLFNRILKRKGLKVDCGVGPTRKGCNCTRSIDIGKWEQCKHGCLYCYGNPKIGR
jgi:hypothetical protein